MRLVKHTAANCTPSTRCWCSACDDTSIATVAAPASRMRASSACSSLASGVVCAGLHGLARDARADRPHDADAPPGGSRIVPNDSLEEIGGGGLAVGAGDAEDPHGGRRVAEQGRGHRPERSPHARDPGLGDGERQRALDQQRDGTAGHRLRRMVVAVGDRPGDAREAGSRCRVTAVVGDRHDLDLGIPGPGVDVRGLVETGEQVVPTHARASSRVGHGSGVRVPGARRAPADGPPTKRGPGPGAHDVGTRS